MLIGGEGGCHVSMWKTFSDQCKKGWVGVANGPKQFHRRFRNFFFLTPPPPPSPVFK